MRGVQVMHHIIRPGGFLLNVGPLLYHWAQADDDAVGNNGAEVSIELSLDDVRTAACGLGFVVLEESEAQMQYLADRAGLFQTTYTGVRWVLRKGGPDHDGGHEVMKPVEEQPGEASAAALGVGGVEYTNCCSTGCPKE